MGAMVWLLRCMHGPYFLHEEMGVHWEMGVVLLRC